MDNNTKIILPQMQDYMTEQFNCKGCENVCLVNKMKFSNGKIFFTGNKCEKIYTNQGKDAIKGNNHYNYKLSLFTSFIKPKLEQNKLTIGIPRALNMYENFPFWSELLYNCGMNVVLSRPSTFKQYEKGIGTVMSDNICFPAKLMHGHIFDLLQMKVDRIFFPFVVYEIKEGNSNKDKEIIANSYNCPVVSGYSEVIKSSIDTSKKYGVELDAPVINFDDEKLLKKACWKYIKQFNISKNIFEKAFKNAIIKFIEYKQRLKQNCKEIYEESVQAERTIILVAGRPYHIDQLIQHKLTDMIADFGVDVISEDIIRDENYTLFSELNTVSQWTYTNRIMRAAQFVGMSEQDIHFIEITSFGCGPDSFIVDEVSEILKSRGKSMTLLKVDDVNNIGSLKLRVRSLLESLKLRSDGNREYQILKQTPIYRKNDITKTILVPHFSDFYSPFIETFFEMMGYKIKTLPPCDEESIQMGLQYSNNEICYPATLVIGDFVRALKSEKYDNNDIVLGMTQTGGQCRATNYIMLIKKALLAAGYDNIPVISIAFSEGLHNQQDFVLNWKTLLKIAMYALLYADSISKMYYSAVSHEITKGQSLIIRNKYIKEAQSYVKAKNTKGLLELLKSAVEEFNAVLDLSKRPPKIGIVGEIYVKYNNIGHKGVVKWLVEQGAEVVMPPLLSFFVQWFVNRKTNIKLNLADRDIISEFLPLIIQGQLNRIMNKVSRIAAEYKLWIPFSDIQKDALEAEKIISLATQFGEGWLIPAEIANFNKHNIQNVVSLQPFGCIANHIISKGIEKRIKEQYPNMNLLFLDFDSGVSDVNVHNRLHFMLKNAREHINSVKK
jgi:predicted nucleotide-binding protein (sugar kinase/HSP70/actin superfamily)